MNPAAFSKLALAVLMAVGLSSCATYQYSKNVKMISFEDEVTKGKSVGPIRGEDCIWSLFGYPLGGAPTLDRAFANARTRSSSSALRSFSGSTTQNEDQAIRYINNVSTEYDGFNAVVVAKQCLVVKGLGYK